MRRKLGRMLLLAACVACVVCVLTAPGRAELINLTAADDLNELLVTGYSAATEFTTTDMAAGDLDTKVYSQAFLGNNGIYAYIYQVDNIGDANDAFVEQYTIGRFGGEEIVQMGYFTDTAPGDFEIGVQMPEDTGCVAELSTGLVISFYYNNRYDRQIDVGEKSLVMYVLCESAPGMVTGNVINSSVASGSVVGAVPEPGAMTLLVVAGLSAIGVIVMKRKHS